MSMSGGAVIPFPLKRKKKPEMRHRALPAPGSVEQQIQDIDTTIKGLLEIRRALKAAYKRSLGIAANTLCVWIVWCHQSPTIVYLSWLIVRHKR